jgi:hypothetical protein
MLFHSFLISYPTRVLNFFIGNLLQLSMFRQEDHQIDPHVVPDEMRAAVDMLEEIRLSLEVVCITALFISD